MTSKNSSTTAKRKLVFTKEVLDDIENRITSNGESQRSIAKLIGVSEIIEICKFFLCN